MSAAIFWSGMQKFTSNGLYTFAKKCEENSYLRITAMQIMIFSQEQGVIFNFYAYWTVLWKLNGELHSR